MKRTLRTITNKSRKIFSCLVCLSFILNTLTPSLLFAQGAPTYLNLPVPGTMVAPTPGFIPATVKGLTIDPQNPLHFDFILDTGHTGLQGEELRAESTKLIKYFLASLTVPENELWVNLSPYEQDRIIAENFGVTEMGRDLLAQDYLLKQLTASLIHPDKELGKEFWSRVREKAYRSFGTTEIPMNTFNKVWIIPDRALVYENENTAFIVESHLKVMLDEDYVALDQAAVSDRPDNQTQMSSLQSQILKEVVIPEIEKEVNEGKTFANLRQIYHSLILATWYKVSLKNSILGQVYVDQNKVRGVDIEDKDAKEKIYQQYVKAFETGVYNFIKEDYDPVSQELIPRKYFSGGFHTADKDGAQLAQVIQRDLIKGDIGQYPQAAQQIVARAARPVGDFAMISWTAVETITGDRATTDLSADEAVLTNGVKTPEEKWAKERAEEILQQGVQPKHIEEMLGIAKEVFQGDEERMNAVRARINLAQRSETQVLGTRYVPEAAQPDVDRLIKIEAYWHSVDLIKMQANDATFQKLSNLRNRIRSISNMILDRLMLESDSFPIVSTNDLGDGDMIVIFRINRYEAPLMFMTPSSEHTAGHFNDFKGKEVFLIAASKATREKLGLSDGAMIGTVPRVRAALDRASQLMESVRGNKSVPLSFTMTEMLPYKSEATPRLAGLIYLLEHDRPLFERIVRKIIVRSIDKDLSRNRLLTHTFSLVQTDGHLGHRVRDLFWSALVPNNRVDGKIFAERVLPLAERYKRNTPLTEQEEEDIQYLMRNIGGFFSPMDTAVLGSEDQKVIADNAMAAKRVLVVDDEEAIRNLNKTILTRAGYEVTIAADIDAAKDAMAQSDYDLVLSDIRDRTGRQTGFELADYVIATYPEVRVKLMSGEYSGVPSLAVQESGRYFGILPKPFTLAEMKTAVAEVIGPAGDEAMLGGEHIEIPRNFAAALGNHALNPTSIYVVPVKGEGTPKNILDDPEVRFALETTTAAALGSFNLRGRGRKSPKGFDIKLAADGGAVQMVEETARPFIGNHPQIAIVELASEGARDGAPSSPLGRISHMSLNEHGYIDTVEFDAKGRVIRFDFELYKRTIDALRAQGVKIYYKITDALEKTEGLTSPEALNRPTDSWALTALVGDVKAGQYRLLIDDNSRTAGTSYNAPVKADIQPLDLPSKTIPAILKARGYQEGTDEYEAALKRVVFFALGPRDITLDKESGNLRHMHLIQDALAFKQKHGIQVVTDSDGDLMPRILAQLGEIDLLDNRIIIVTDRSGSAEAAAAKAFARTVSGAHFLARQVSTKATADAVTPENAGSYFDFEIETSKILHYDHADLHEIKDAADEPAPTVVAMTAVTGAKDRFGPKFAEAMRRVTYNDEENVVTTNTLLTDTQGNVYVVQVTFESEDIKVARRSIDKATPAASKVAEDLGLHDPAMAATVITPTSFEVLGFGQVSIDAAGSREIYEHLIKQGILKLLEGDETGFSPTASAKVAEALPNKSEGLSLPEKFTGLEFIVHATLSQVKRAAESYGQRSGDTAMVGISMNVLEAELRDALEETRAVYVTFNDVPLSIEGRTEEDITARIVAALTEAGVSSTTQFEYGVDFETEPVGIDIWPVDEAMAAKDRSGMFEAIDDMTDMEALLRLRQRLQGEISFEENNPAMKDVTGSDGQQMISTEGYGLIQANRSIIEDIDRRIEQLRKRGLPDTAIMTTPGGIDLNPSLLNLQIKRDGNGVPLPVEMQPIQEMHIDGFVPVIINIAPIHNVPMLLGVADVIPEVPSERAQDAEQEKIPALSQRKFVLRSTYGV